MRPKRERFFVDDSKQCCSGLEKTMSNGQRACQVGRECPAQTNYTCRSAKCGDSKCAAEEKCLRDCNVVDGKLLIKVSGNGFTVGDIVSVKTASPQKNDVVYYNGVKMTIIAWQWDPDYRWVLSRDYPGKPWFLAMII